MTRPLLLDLYCGAGGAAAGYEAAGFEVVGVDNVEQPRYPFEFHEADAIQTMRNLRRGEFAGRRLEDFAAIHASPPCQAYSTLRGRHPGKVYADLMRETRKMLVVLNLPWVIENVPGAPMWKPVQLCGTQFEGLRVIRHRLFESNRPLVGTPCGKPWDHPKVVTTDRSLAHFGEGDPSTDYLTVAGRGVGTLEDAKDAMGIEWTMTRREVNQAVPPPYAEFIGGQLLDTLGT